MAASNVSKQTRGIRRYPFRSVLDTVMLSLAELSSSLLIESDDKRGCAALPCFRKEAEGLRDRMDAVIAGGPPWSLLAQSIVERPRKQRLRSSEQRTRHETPNLLHNLHPCIPQKEPRSCWLWLCGFQLSAFSFQSGPGLGDRETPQTAKTPTYTRLLTFSS